MKRNVSVVSTSNFVAIFISGKIIKEMPGSVASGTPYINDLPFRINSVSDPILFADDTNIIFYVFCTMHFNIFV
jgi:hypothetical protein